MPGLIVYRFDAPLFFPNAPYFKERVLTLVAAAETPTRWFMLNAEAITYIDATGVDTLRELRADLADAGIQLTVARAKVMLRGVLDSAGSPPKSARKTSSRPYARACWHFRAGGAVSVNNHSGNDPISARTLTAFAMTRLTTTNEINDCSAIVSFAQADSGIASVGLNAKPLVIPM